MANDAGSRVLKRRPSSLLRLFPIQEEASQTLSVWFTTGFFFFFFAFIHQTSYSTGASADPDIIQQRFSKIIAASTNKIGVGTRGENSWRVGGARWLPRAFLEDREKRENLVNIPRFFCEEHSNTWKEVCYAPLWGGLWCLTIVEKLRKNITQKIILFETFAMGNKSRIKNRKISIRKE